MTLREQSVAVQEQFVEDQRSYSIFDMLVKCSNRKQASQSIDYLLECYLEHGRRGWRLPKQPSHAPDGVLSVLGAFFTPSHTI